MQVQIGAKDKSSGDNLSNQQAECNREDESSAGQLGMFGGERTHKLFAEWVI